MVFLQIYLEISNVTECQVLSAATAHTLPESIFIKQELCSALGHLKIFGWIQFGFSFSLFWFSLVGSLQLAGDWTAITSSSLLTDPLQCDESTLKSPAKTTATGHWLSQNKCLIRPLGRNVRNLCEVSPARQVLVLLSLLLAINHCKSCNHHQPCARSINIYIDVL